jgi:gamma-glutamylcyclotransferase (GGCT)/AIG2-like uncharacterized protein YtfP
MIEMKEYLFSYGTLQKENVQMDLFGRRLKGTPDVLQRFKIEMIEITDESFLSKGEEKFQRTLVRSNNQEDKIEGTLLELTSEELEVTDQYEPKNYKRIKVILQSGKEAWIYLAE